MRQGADHAVYCRVLSFAEGGRNKKLVVCCALCFVCIALLSCVGCVGPLCGGAGGEQVWAGWVIRSVARAKP